MVSKFLFKANMFLPNKKYSHAFCKALHSHTQNTSTYFPKENRLFTSQTNPRSTAQHSTTQHNTTLAFIKFACEFQLKL